MHEKENTYRETEDKLIQMIIEYRELVQHDEVNTKTKERDQNEPTQPVPSGLKRNFSTLVNLESRCKIMHYELNNASL